MQVYARMTHSYPFIIHGMSWKRDFRNRECQNNQRNTINLKDITAF